MKTTKPLNEQIWLSVFLVVILYVVVLVVPQIIMGALGVPDPTSDLINFVIYSIFWFVLVPFGLRLPNKVNSVRAYISDIQLNNLKPLGRLIILGVCLGGLFLLILAVSSFLMGSFSLNIRRIMPPESWKLLYGNIGAFFEEVAIRGVILILLLKRYDKTKAVFFSAFLFGIGHILTFFLGNDLFSSAIQVIYAFCLGILFATLVIKTNSLLPGIIAHMIINSFSDVFFSALDLKDVSYLILISSILTTVLGLIILKYIPRKTNDENQNH